nr:hypothetical protein [Variovorax sp. RA8]
MNHAMRPTARDGAGEPGEYAFLFSPQQVFLSIMEPSHLRDLLAGLAFADELQALRLPHRQAWHVRTGVRRGREHLRCPRHS